MEGRQAVRELLSARRRRVTEVWMTEGSDPSPILGEIDRLARDAHVPVRLVSPRRLESVQGTDAPQGVVAFAEPLTAASLDELVLGWNEGTSSSESDFGPGLDDEVDDDELDDEIDDDESQDDEDGEGFFIELDTGDLDDIEDVLDDDEFPVLVQLVDETDEPDDDEDADIVPVALANDGDVTMSEATNLEGGASPADGVAPAMVEDSEENAAGDAEETGADAAEEGSSRTAAAIAKALAVSTAPVGAQREHAFLVLLEGVTDPQNLGAILRSAECAGVTGVAVPRHRSVHVTPAVTKAAAGAIEYLQMALLPGMPSALQDLERLGVMTVGLDERGTTSLYDLDLSDRPVALVLGSEGTGLSPLSRRRCEVLCSIPVGGAIPSLNVSAAAAVACFEVARQRKRGAQKRR
ncbi:MAG: RNA methyltransferase [Acidimicrobiales bacterium]